MACKIWLVARVDEPLVIVYHLSSNNVELNKQKIKIWKIERKEGNNREIWRLCLTPKKPGEIRHGRGPCGPCHVYFCYPTTQQPATRTHAMQFQRMSNVQCRFLVVQ